MNYHTRYASISAPVAACLVGGGAFGQSFLAQARNIRKLEGRIAVDISAEKAGQALLAAGFAAQDIRLCTTAAEARQAYDSGLAVAAGRLCIVMGLPFDIFIEATGHPEAAARHAIAAIDARRHVLLVTKETDSVAGPMLARLARANGVDIAPVDGDQPSLLIDLITWGETLGFEILAGGKSSEYDFVFDPADGTVTSNGRAASLPGLAAHWAPGVRTVLATSQARADVIARQFPLRAVPDLCELTLVANATGFGADTPALHAPVARIPEVADLFAPRNAGGLLTGARRLDVFHHLRLADEASFAGGVFITVRCHDRESWSILAEKGHVVSRSGDTAMIYLPRHLLGLEAATSVLDLAGLGQSPYPAGYRQHTDLAAVATTALAAGTLLTARGHHHTIDGVTAQMRPARPLAANEIAPYYLVANHRLSRAIAPGQPITLADLDIGDASALLALRQRQDREIPVPEA